MKKVAKIIIVFVFLLSPNIVEAQHPDKQVIIEKIGEIALFTKWPKNKSSKKFKILIINEFQFSARVSGYYSDKKIKSKDVEVVQKNLDFIKGDVKNFNFSAFHIIFIPTIIDADLQMLITNIGTKGVLTFSNGKGNSQKGVMVNFYNTKNSLPFEINQKAVVESGLYIDSILLNEVRIINPQK